MQMLSLHSECVVSWAKHHFYSQINDTIIKSCHETTRSFTDSFKGLRLHPAGFYLVILRLVLGERS